MTRWLACLTLVLAAPAASAALWAQEQVPRPFTIEAVDAATGRGVPLVELETTNQQLFVTDSSGLVAIVAPDLMGQKVYFQIRSHGYEYPADGFGFRGKALKIEPGGTARLELKRINVAERLYRVTGGGIYRDTVMLGRPVPLRDPLLNGQVFGCDSVMTAVYRGKLYWFWGDTNQAAYPLGHFHITGATSALPKDGGLEPAIGVNYDYFVNPEGFARPTAQMPGEGPTWISGVTVLRDKRGEERMYASYLKVRNSLEAYEWGVVVWNDEQNKFEKVTTFDQRHVNCLTAQDHPFQIGDYVYFAAPLPLVRVKADAEHYSDPRRYEAFTCLKTGSRIEDRQIDRDAAGRARYAWKADTPPVSQKDQTELLKAGVLTQEDLLIALRDVETGREVQAHRGSVYWNDYRKRWILIVSEIYGQSSMLGEVWFAEADSPTGPWVYAQKVVTHDKYSFYNPKHHPYFDQHGGREIYFEGTYTHSFSGNLKQTPRYDYNQVMYKLDLADARLNLPAAVYQTSKPEEEPAFAFRRAGAHLAFFALESEADGAVAVYAKKIGGHLALETAPPAAGVEPQNEPLFYGLPPDMKSPPATATPLFEFVHDASGKRAYSIDPQWSLAGYRRSAKPICIVWNNPVGSLIFGK